MHAAETFLSSEAEAGRFRGAVLLSRNGKDLRDHNKHMVKSVEGIYRNGKVELAEPLEEAEGSRVIVTWYRSSESVQIRSRGIEEGQAHDLRQRLSAFAEDWDRPEMDVYDDMPSRQT